ncbi:hypothetical protein E2C01_026300 [Portunus trituberculatus]|uniref:CCHC-type domain-containing protein n=1 Tax=Portunus trituberculatus TaxID=210409 RepID=A0A5B7EFM4_PORTR|nr:hypothetical protein [Portunus trituberculatus]
MKEITTTMQFNQRPVPTFKERTCVEYWTFKDNFEKHVRAGSITDSRKLELLISAYSEKCLPVAASGEMQQQTQQERPNQFTKRAIGLVIAISTEMEGESCFICQGNHEASDCGRFRNMDVGERVKLMRQDCRCFSCFRLGHWIKNCVRRVKVRVTKGWSEEPGVITGALLDSGSDRSYCTRDLANQLHAKGKLITLSIGTITDEGKEVTTEELNLKLTGIGTRRNRFISLCRILIVPSLPSSLKGSIARNGDIFRWPHLQDIPPTCIPGGVDLLIGLDTSQALLPLEIKAGGDGEPFTTHNLLGWTVNGPIKFKDGEAIRATNVRTTGMTVIAQRQQSAIRYGSILRSDFSLHCGETISMEDRGVIELWSSTAQ